MAKLNLTGIWRTKNRRLSSKKVYKPAFTFPIRVTCSSSSFTCRSLIYVVSSGTCKHMYGHMAQFTHRQNLCAYVVIFYLDPLPIRHDIAYRPLAKTCVDMLCAGHVDNPWFFNGWNPWIKHWFG